MTRDINSDTASVSSGFDTTAANTGQQSEDLSTTIVLAVADALDTDPIDLSPPLYELIDPDALDALFESAGDGSDTYFTISEWGCTVTVFANGRVLVDADD